MHRNKMPLSFAALALGVLIATPALAQQYPQGRGANDGGMVSAKTGGEQPSATPKVARTKTSQTAPKARAVNQQAAPREAAQKYPTGRSANDGGFATMQTQNQPTGERQFAWEGNDAAYGGQFRGGQYYNYNPGYAGTGYAGTGYVGAGYAGVGYGGYRPGYAWQGNPGYVGAGYGGWQGNPGYVSGGYGAYRPGYRPSGYAWQGNSDPAYGVGGDYYAFSPGYAWQGNPGYVEQQTAWAGNAPVGGDFYDFSPGWNSGPTTVSMTTSVNGGDTAACRARFRSFDPASGTYRGFDGQRHPCP
jgi:hypothetical protein